MSLVTRRRLLLLAGAGFLGLVGARLALPRLFRPGKPRALSEEAAAFVRECFAGIDRARIWDSHVHAVGIGAGGTGCEVDEEMRSHLHPIKRLQFDLYRAAVGLDREETADADYIARLLGLQRTANPRGRMVLLAFDHHVGEDGVPRPDRSAIHTPNDYVLRLAAEHPEIVAGVSIHPYRPDALERLERAAEAGAVAVKWLPNAMGIDPASSRCDGFYRRLAALEMPLITHAGKEYAVGAEAGQAFGNPLLLRRALDEGVRVVVAHCAGLGSFPDLDAAGTTEVASLELFLRLLRDPRYERNLFGDISAIAQINYGGRPLRELLTAPELHERLVYGSDYPMPSLRFLNSPRSLELRGFLSSRVRKHCAELFDANPLLYDFVVKRSVRVERDGREFRFAPGVFETARLFDGVSRRPKPSRAPA